MGNDDFRLPPEVIREMAPKYTEVPLLCQHCEVVILDKYKEPYRKKAPTAVFGHCSSCVDSATGPGNNHMAICRKGCGELGIRVREIE